jgi:hypothetical protein
VNPNLTTTVIAIANANPIATTAATNTERHSQQT